MDDNKKYLRVRRFSDGQEVQKVATTEYQAERVMMGMLINMNTDEYYIDDSDFDGPPAPPQETTTTHRQDNVAGIEGAFIETSTTVKDGVVTNITITSNGPNSPYAKENEPKPPQEQADE